MTADRPRVVACASRIPDAIARVLRERFDAHDVSIATPSAWPQDVEALVVTPATRLPAQTIATLPSTLRLIASYSVGVDHIDLTAAKARGVRVSNTPDVLTDATADIAMLLILSACRRASACERELRAGHWRGLSMQDMFGVDLAGRTLGVFGFGRIGQATARRARAFRMQIAYHGPQRKPAAEASLEARFEPDARSFLRSIDVLSLHAPLTPATRRFVNRETLAALKPGSVVVNTARGGLVDDEALIEALKSRHLFAAGLDVYEGEPDVNPGYLQLDNLTLLPHIGSATYETRHAMGMKVVENVEAWFAGKPLPTAVV